MKEAYTEAASRRWNENDQNSSPASFLNVLTRILQMLLAYSGRLNNNDAFAFSELLFVFLFCHNWNWANSAAADWGDIVSTTEVVMVI